MNRKAMRSNLLLLLTAFIWGVAFVAQSVGMEYVGAFTFNMSRFLLGGLVLVPVAAVMVRRERGCGAEQNSVAEQGRGAERNSEPETEQGRGAERNSEPETEQGRGAERNSETEQSRGAEQRFRDGIRSGIACGVFLFIAGSLQQIGVSMTTVGKAGFITALYIVMVPVMGIFLRRRVSPAVWISVALAVIGMYLLCITEGLRINRGDVCLFLCAVGFTFHILVIDRVSPKANGVLISCVQFFTAGILSAAGAFLFETPGLGAVMAAWKPIAYAGAMSCGIGYTLQVVAQKDTDPTVASLIMSLESVFSLLAGWVILHQVLSLRELLGCVLVFAAVILAQLL